MLTPTSPLTLPLLGCALLLPVAAQAQTAPAAPPQVIVEVEEPQAAATPRFTFAPAAGGTLKMDTQTGKVSLCAQTSTGFACEAVPDSRDAYEAEITRLQQQLATVQNQLEGKSGPLTPPAPDPAEQAELDAAFDYAERALNWLRGMVEQFSSQPPPAPPAGKPQGSESL